MSVQPRYLAAASVMLIFVLVSCAMAKYSGPRGSKKKGGLIIKAAIWGPSQEEANAAARRVENSPAVQSFLNGVRYRLLSLDYLAESKSKSERPPTRFRLVFYDYTNDRAIVAEADFAGRESITVREEYSDPLPNDEEFNEALAILRGDSRYSNDLASGAMKAYQPMPPTTILDGTVERLLNVGLRGAGTQNEIVGVSIKRGEAVRYEGNAPPQSRSVEGSCGPSSAGQTTTSNGTAGQATLTVIDQTSMTTLWEMLVIRPSASSGTRKSGIEIRDVKYKGKSVLKRGHVPVLNVQYNPSTCGPYRDWQWQEDMFNAPDAGATDLAPGIRLLAAGQVATTVLETGSDTGNFRGVAIYVQNTQYGPEAVLVSEMQAGWYRYLMEWRFAADGTIRPRYAFGTTNNSCVCDVHNHHAYWRFDFDVVQPNNKVFQVERGRKFLQPLTTELTRQRNIGTNRSLLIQNSSGNEAYELVPGRLDGPADAFAVSDFWVLRYKEVIGGTALQNEIDDGFNQTTSANAFIQINPFINGESIVGQDVVVWYGGHFIHSDGANLLDPNRSPEILSGEHVIGPDLRPVRW
ncbi:MAG: hypothetical protein ABI481_00035 [Pyrinomonadaceae bacterium]